MTDKDLTMTDANERQSEKPVTAAIFALIGGIWMLFTALGRTGWTHGMFGGSGHHGGNWSGNWMHQNGIMCGFMSGDFGFVWPWVGLLTGALAVTGAIVILASTAHHTGWGIAMIVAAVLGMLLGTGGLIAAILVIVGGVLAITWHPTNVSSSDTSS